jgi:hypothetical protein
MTRLKYKVFGIGVPKSGSNSLADALTHLGYNVLHFGREEFQEKSDKALRFRKNLELDRDALTGFERFTAFVDSPVWHSFKRLSIENPNAKFVLTYRDPAACALSWMRMQHYLHRSIQPADAPQNFSAARRRVEDHIDAVFDFFAHNTNKLLILDQADPSHVKWKQLAKFLELKTPHNKPFPHSFQHKGFVVKGKLNSGRLPCE